MSFFFLREMLASVVCGVGRLVIVLLGRMAGRTDCLYFTSHITWVMRQQWSSGDITIVFSRELAIIFILINGSKTRSNLSGLCWILFMIWSVNLFKNNFPRKWLIKRKLCILLYQRGGGRASLAPVVHPLTALLYLFQGFQFNICIEVKFNNRLELTGRHWSWVDHHSIQYTHWTTSLLLVSRRGGEEGEREEGEGWY